MSYFNFHPLFRGRAPEIKGESSAFLVAIFSASFVTKISVVLFTDYNFWGAVSSRAGRYVQFTPTGDIMRDTLDTKFALRTLFFNDTTLEDCFVGHTQEDGVNLRKVKELKEKIDREAETQKKLFEYKMADRGSKI